MIDLFLKYGPGVCLGLIALICVWSYVRGEECRDLCAPLYGEIKLGGECYCDELSRSPE